MPKHGFRRGNAVTEADIAEGLRAIWEEEQIYARVRVEADLVGYTLVVTAECWREVNGVRIGLSKNVSIWSQDGRPLLSVMLIALHRAYAAFKELAYLKPSIDKLA